MDKLSAYPRKVTPLSKLVHMGIETFLSFLRQSDDGKDDVDDGTEPSVFKWMESTLARKSLADLRRFAAAHNVPGPTDASSKRTLIEKIINHCRYPSLQLSSFGVKSLIL
jgi:hypothetical protein